MAQAGPRGFVQIVETACVDIRPKPRFGLFDNRREHVFERTRLGLVKRRNWFGVLGWAL